MLENDAECKLAHCVHMNHEDVDAQGEDILFPCLYPTLLGLKQDT